MRRSRQLRRAGLAAATVAVLAATAACSGDTPPAPTVKVDRGTVATTVSASGTLVAITEQNLGFANRGQIAELMVKVGDKVEAGQPLARLDDGALTQALRSAQAKLDQQRASFRKISGSNSVEKAASSLDSARSILDATEASVAATAESDASAVERARVQLEFDERMLDRARDCPADTTQQQQQSSDPAAGTGGTGTTSTGTGTSTGTSGTGSGGSSNREADPDDDSDDTSMGAPQTTVVQPVAFSAPMVSAQCQANIDSAERSVINSETALASAEQRQNTDAAQGQVSIANARKSVADAEGTLDGATNDRPADTAMQDAAVRDAQVAVDKAQLDLEAATLKAPIAGTVSAVNGAVGEFVNAASGSTTLAPGSSARLPGAASASSSSSGAGASAAGGGGGGGGALITLSGLDTFQLVVPFEESDAAQVAQNQPVEVSIDAVPGLTKPATVVSVAPTASSVNGVTSYYTTIVLNESDPRIKDGQTAQADVLTRSIENALRVPSAAVRQNGGQSLVNIPGRDGGEPVPTPFTPGLIGDEFTEVTSGLNEGQEVLLPQATVTATQGGGGPQGRNGG